MSEARGRSRKTGEGLTTLVMPVVAWVTLSAFDASIPARADNLSVRIFNVDVFLSGQPDCADRADGTKLLVSVAPFSEFVGTDEIVSELARRAAEAGRQAVYSIRILSFAPGRGADVTATALSCKSPSDGSREAILIDTVSSAAGAKAYVIPGTGRFGSERSIASVETRLVGDLSPRDLGELKERIVARMKQPDDGLRTSCPFDPDLAFRMQGKDEVWWLVSTSCRAAMLVGPTSDWRREPTRPLEATDLADFRRFAGP